MDAFFCISDVRTTFPVNEVLATAAVVLPPPMAAILLVPVTADSLPLVAALGVTSVDFLLVGFTAAVLMLGLIELLEVGLTTLRVLSTFPVVVALLFPTTFLFVSTARLFVMPVTVGVTLEVVVAGLDTLFCLLLVVDLVALLSVDVLSGPVVVVVLRLSSIFDLKLIINISLITYTTYILYKDK